MVAMDPWTGRVRAMVGGFAFDQSRFNALTGFSLPLNRFNRLFELPLGLKDRDVTLRQKLFGFQGRMGRRQYWGDAIAINVVFILTLVLIVMIARAREVPEGAIDGLTGVLLFAALLFYVWTGICVTAKRCHDRNRSGWYQLMGIIPIFGWIGMLIELGFAAGTKGDNRFGPSPKGNVSNQVTNVFK